MVVTQSVSISVKRLYRICVLLASFGALEYIVLIGSAREFAALLQQA